MKEVKITIPDNCELVKEGDTYIVREKKNNPPRSWEEFCENYPIKENECYLNSLCEHISKKDDGCSERDCKTDKNLCISKEEVEAFLALMQLRQLRKAWVGDWEQEIEKPCAVLLYDMYDKTVRTAYDTFWCMLTISFPTKEMAKDFLSCFRDLCETAKILL